jgi:Fibronectin type III domain
MRIPQNRITKAFKVSIVPILMLAASPIVQASPSVQCPADRPCTSIYQEGNTVVVSWTGNGEDYDAYNVRWSRPGRNETQRERPGGDRGEFRVNNAHRGTTYTFKVQGCKKGFLSSSKCSPWSETSITTRP